MPTHRISLVAVISFGVAVLVAGAGYLQYDFSASTLRDHFAESLRLRSDLRSTAAAGVYREWEQKIIDAGGMVAALNDVREAAARADIGMASRVLVEHFPTVSVASGAEMMILVDDNAETLGAWGLRQINPPGETLARAAMKTQRPAASVKCAERCTHTTAVPVFNDGKVVGALLLSVDMRNFMVMYSAITDQRLELTPLGSASILELPPLPDDGGPVRVQLHPIAGWPASHAFFTSIDSSGDARALSRLRTQMAILDVVLFSLLTCVLLTTLWFALRRVKIATRALDLIGDAQRLSAPAQLAVFRAALPVSRVHLWRDEIDDLTSGLSIMGERLQAVHQELAESYGALQEQLVYSEDLMESVAVPILCLDSQGRVADFNVAFAQFFGATRADVLNRSLDILAVEQTAFGALLRAASWIRPQAFGTPREASFIRPAGSTCQCLVAGGPYMRPDGSIIGSIFTFVDLTLLRRTEERFSAIARQLPGALFQFSLVGGRWTILFASDGLESFTGLPSSAFYEDFAVFLGHVHPDDRVAFTESVRQAVTLTENWSFGFRITHTDGSIRWVRGSGAVPALPVSNPVWTGILLDVTPEHLAHVAAHDAIASQAAAETAVAAKDGHIRMISHEIRNTLQSVLGYAAILKRGAFTTNSQPTTADLTALQYAANDLFEIVNDLLTLQRCASGAQEPMKPIRVGEFVDRIEQHVKPWLRTNSLHVEISAALRDIDIITDGHLLRRAVTNLLSNACKYTTRGQIHLTVSAREHRHFVIEVRDTGCGIAPDELSRLGQPFQQATRVRDRRSLGTGLGLVLVEQFVGFLNGSLQVESEIGVGTAVTITVPFVKVDAPGLENPTTTSRADEDVSLRSVSVLVIDDDPVIRDVVSRLLRPHVAAVDQAHCGLHGLQRLSETRYNLVVTDLGLPDISGLDMLRTYRAENPKAATAFILLTGNADAGRCAGTSLANAVCLLKPVDEDVLVGTAKRLLALPTNTVDPTIEPPHPMRRSLAANALKPAVVLDSPRLLGAFKGDTTAAVSHMHAFIVDTLRQIDLAVQLSAAASNSAVLSIAHRLAGTCATIGADRLAQMAEELIQHMPVWTTQERRRIFRALYSEVALLEQEFRTIVSDPNPLLTETVCP